jgi:hypothetical protein
LKVGYETAIKFGDQSIEFKTTAMTSLVNILVGFIPTALFISCPQDLLSDMTLKNERCPPFGMILKSMCLIL